MTPILRVALRHLSNDLGTPITPRLLVRGFAAAAVLLLCLGAALGFVFTVEVVRTP